MQLLLPCNACKCSIAELMKAATQNLALPAGFEGETEDELTVFPGDEVTVQVEVEGWVQITRDKDGQKGLVPASYLEHS